MAALYTNPTSEPGLLLNAPGAAEAQKEAELRQPGLKTPGAPTLSPPSLMQRWASWDDTAGVQGPRALPTPLPRPRTPSLFAEAQSLS